MAGTGNALPQPPTAVLGSGLFVDLAEGPGASDGNRPSRFWKTVPSFSYGKGPPEWIRSHPNCEYLVDYGVAGG